MTENTTNQFKVFEKQLVTIRVKSAPSWVNFCYCEAVSEDFIFCKNTREKTLVFHFSEILEICQMNAKERERFFQLRQKREAGE